MTREEAISKIVLCATTRGLDLAVAVAIADSLIVLDLLKVELPIPDSVAAISEIMEPIVYIEGREMTCGRGRLSVTSAQDLIGKLLKAGFKITR